MTPEEPKASPGGVELRAVMRHLPAGVAILTARDGDVDHTVTVNSLLSVSLDPPLILVSLGRSSNFADVVRRTGTWGVSILPAGSGPLALSMARRAGERTAGLGDVPHDRGITGVALLEVALATLECRVHDIHTAGDHDLFIGHVVATSVGAVIQAAVPDSSPEDAELPLVNWRGAFGTFRA